MPTASLCNTVVPCASLFPLAQHGGQIVVSGKPSQFRRHRLFNSVGEEMMQRTQLGSLQQPSTQQGITTLCSLVQTPLTIVIDTINIHPQAPEVVKHRHAPTRPLCCPQCGIASVRVDARWVSAMIHKVPTYVHVSLPHCKAKRSGSVGGWCVRIAPLLSYQVGHHGQMSVACSPMKCSSSIVATPALHGGLPAHTTSMSIIQLMQHCKYTQAT